MDNPQGIITRIPFNYQGNVFRSPMPFSRYDPFNRIWKEYMVHKIEDVFVLAESQEFQKHANKDLLDFYKLHGLDAYHYPIPDFQVPRDPGSLETAIEAFEARALEGKNISVHCLAGLGRTGLFLGCIGKRHLNLEGQQVISWIRQIIPGALENPLQEQFVINF